MCDAGERRVNKSIDGIVVQLMSPLLNTMSMGPSIVHCVWVNSTEEVENMCCHNLSEWFMCLSFALTTRIIKLMAKEQSCWTQFEFSKNQWMKMQCGWKDDENMITSDQSFKWVHFAAQKKLPFEIHFFLNSILLLTQLCQCLNHSFLNMMNLSLSSPPQETAVAPTADLNHPCSWCSSTANPPAFQQSVQVIQTQIPQNKSEGLFWGERLLAVTQKLGRRHLKSIPTKGHAHH